MGIGRREFLRLFGGAIAAAASSKVVLIDQDLFINRKLGIALHKPPGWSFTSIRQFADMKSGQIINEDLDAVTLEEIGSLADPVVIFNRPNPTNKPRFDPGVTVYVEPLELEAGLTLICVCANEESFYQDVLLDYHNIVAPKLTTISNCPTIEFTSEFTLENEAFPPIAVRSRTIISERKPAIYTLRMFDSPRTGQDESAVFDKLVQGLRYV